MDNANRLAAFFAIGRERGWDTTQRKWTVNQLMDAKGLSPTLDELGVRFATDSPPKWSGDRFGAAELRQNICSSQRYRLGTDGILVTLGTQQANLLAFAGLVSAGDEILFELPTWMHAIGAAQMLGARAKYIRRHEELGWRFDLDLLGAKLASGVKVLYLCNPNNPTGAELDETELTEICQLADRSGVWVVCDEVYRGLEWDGKARPPAMCDLYARGISTASVSKTVGLDSLRLGWIACADRSLLVNCAQAKQLNSTPHISCFDEIVATAALAPDHFNRQVTRSLQAAAPNRAALKTWIEEQPIMAWQIPEAGFLSFPSYRAAVNSWQLCERLLEKPYRTYLIPGICYDSEDHVRIAFGPSTPLEQFKIGLDCLSDAMVRVQ